MSRYHVYTDARHPNNTLAIGALLSVYATETTTTLSTLYVDDSTATTRDNPYTVPANGICDFYIEDANPWVLAAGDTIRRPLFVSIATGEITTVLDYGATGDGTTDDSTAVQACVDALGTDGGVVLFPAGKTYLLSSSSISVPHDLERTMVFSGYGATVKLSSGAPRFLDLIKVDDHDTFQHITVEGFLVDANSIGGKHHVIIGDYIAGVQTSHVNIDDILIRDVRAINVPADITTTNHRYGVYLGCKQAVESEGTENYITNVSCENVRIEGGNGGIVAAGIRTAGTEPYEYNIRMDNIRLSDCYHDTTLEPTAFYASSNFHIGSVATGGSVIVKDCEGIGSGDVGIEINGFSDITVDGFTARNNVGPAVYQRNYNYVLNDSQYMSFKNIRVYRDVSQDEANLCPGLQIDCSAGAIDNIVAEDIHFFGETTTVGSGAVAFYLSGGSTGTVGTLNLRDVSAKWTGWTRVAVGSLIGAWVTIPLGSGDGLPTKFILEGLHADFEGTQTGGASFGTRALTTSGIIDYDIRGITTVLDITDQTTNYASCAYIGASTSESSGSIRNVKPLSFSGDTGPRGVYVYASTVNTIPDRLLIEGCDFAVMGAGSYPVSIGDDTNRAKCHVRDCVYGVPPVPATRTTKTTLTIDSVSTHATLPEIVTGAAHGMVAGDWVDIDGITELAAGFYQVVSTDAATHFKVAGTTTGTDTGTCQPSYTDNAGYDEDLIVSGGTVTAIGMSTDAGTTFTATGLTAGVFSLRPGDVICITNSVAPTTTALPKP